MNFLRQFAPRLLFIFLIAFASALAGCRHKHPNDSGPTAGDYQVTFGAELPSKAEAEAAASGLSVVQAAEVGDLPNSVDLSTSLFMPPPGNQRRQNSCVAWAMGYCMETFVMGTTNGWPLNTAEHVASPADLYAKVLRDMGQRCNSGTDPELAMQNLVRNGIASLAESPYSDQACSIPTASGTFGIGGYHSYRTNDLTALKRLLASGTVVPFGADIYSDFPAFRGSGTYRGSGVTINSGRHMMTLVGYDDARGAFRVLNSWGQEWGDHGYCWMGYGTFVATALVAYAADDNRAVEVSPPSASSSVSVTRLDALQYFDNYYGIAYLVLPFALSEPLLVTGGQISYQGGIVVGTIQTHQWAQQSYAWWGLGYPYYFPNGTYTLSLQGTTRAGQTVVVSRSATLGLAPRTGPLASLRSAGAVSLSRPAGLIESRLQPGLRLTMDGQSIVLKRALLH